MLCTCIPHFSYVLQYYLFHQYLLSTMTKSNKPAKSSKRPTIRRPRSAYNFFYKHQRSVILQELSSKNSTSPPTSHLDDTPLDLGASLLKISNTKRRKHRKTHGMISLKDLTSSIAQRWRQASPETKKLYQNLAAQDSLRYKMENASKAREGESDVPSSISSSSGNSRDEFSPRPIEDMLDLPDLAVMYASRCENDLKVTRENALSGIDVGYFMNLLLDTSRN